jgi:kynureninase
MGHNDGMTSIEMGPFPDVSGYEEAVALDASDPLSAFRDRYLHTDPDLVYLDGNSLGRAPVAALDRVDEVARKQWGDRMIRAWNDGWWDLQIHLGDKLAPLLGAGTGEVIISDSTSVNLYKLALSALMAAPDGRDQVVTDDLNFPSDLYILDAAARQAGRTLQIVPSDGINGPVDALTEAIDDTTALVSLSHTVFQSGYTYDMAAMTRIAHEAGAMVLWDCSHSVGAMPVPLGPAGVDLAVGCTYKHLNGGPGSPAFLYVRRHLQERLENPIAGWWGHADPFALELEYRPVSGIRRFHTGTMPILSLTAIEPGIDDVLEASVERIREKSVAMTEYLLTQIREHLETGGFRSASPVDPDRRGSHVSVRHDDAWPINLALIERAGVIPDFRAPYTIRLGVSPLYTRFVDLHTAVQRVVSVVDSGVYRDYEGVVATVT